MTPAADRGRVARLAGLAEVWAYLYFFSPKLAIPDPGWEDALAAAIPQVERATSARAFAAALNDCLLPVLADPWTTATVGQDGAAPPAETSDPLILARSLPGGIGYVNCRNVDAYELADYPALMNRALDEVREAEQLIVDLRWGRQPRPWPNLHRRPLFSTDDCWSSCVFGFFLDTAVPTPARAERVHTGWSEDAWSLYGEGIHARAGEPLQPICRPSFFIEQRYAGTRFDDLAPYTGDLAVLVDDDSIGWLDDGLAALQQQGRAVVVHETDGKPRPRGTPMRVHAGVELHTRPYFLIGSGGGPAPVPDRTLRRDSRDDPVAVAAELLEAPAPRVVDQGGPVRVAPESRRHPAMIPSMRSLSRETRVMGLLKVWAVLREFFPHGELADVDWEHDLGSWIPRVEAADDTRAYYGVFLELGAHLNDSHSGTPGIEHPAADELLGTHTPPLRLGLAEGRVCVTEIRERALASTVHVGAVVTHVDGRPVEEVARERAGRHSASTDHALQHWLYDAGGVLAGARDSEARITFGEHGSAVLTTRRTVAKGFWLLNRRVPHARLGHGIGYINLTSIPSPRDFDRALDALFESRGLVLDIRGYPGFFVQADCVNRFIERPVSSPRFEIPLRSGSNRSAWHASTYEVQPRGPSFRAPVVVLIDASTVSAAEDFCLCLRRAERVTFVGRTSAGTDGNVTHVKLPGGGRFWFTGMRVVDRGGRRFQNVGIEPDVVVERTLQGVREGRDQILDAAIDLLTRSH